MRALHMLNGVLTPVTPVFWSTVTVIAVDPAMLVVPPSVCVPLSVCVELSLPPASPAGVSGLLELLLQPVTAASARTLKKKDRDVPSLVPSFMEIPSCTWR